MIDESAEELPLGRTARLEPGLWVERERKGPDGPDLFDAVWTDLGGMNTQDPSLLWR